MEDRTAAVYECDVSKTKIKPTTYKNIFFYATLSVIYCLLKIPSKEVKGYHRIITASAVYVYIRVGKNEKLPRWRFYLLFLMYIFFYPSVRIYCNFFFFHCLNIIKTEKSANIIINNLELPFFSKNSRWNKCLYLYILFCIQYTVSQYLHSHMT